MRTLRMLLLILVCYLAGWATADLLVPIVLARRTDNTSNSATSHGNATAATQTTQQNARQEVVEHP
jgi:hypothetical protein